MFEAKLIDPGIFGRASRFIYRSVALSQSDDRRQVIDERQKLMESPDTTAINITGCGAAFDEL